METANKNNTEATSNSTIKDDPIVVDSNDKSKNDPKIKIKYQLVPEHLKINKNLIYLNPSLFSFMETNGIYLENGRWVELPRYFKPLSCVPKATNEQELENDIPKEEPKKSDSQMSTPSDHTEPQIQPDSSSKSLPNETELSKIPFGQSIPYPIVQFPLAYQFLYSPTQIHPTGQFRYANCQLSYPQPNGGFSYVPFVPGQRLPGPELFPFVSGPRLPGPRLPEPGLSVPILGPYVIGPGPHKPGQGLCIPGPDPNVPRELGPHETEYGPRLPGPEPNVSKPGPHVSGPGPRVLRLEPGPRLPGPGPNVPIPVPHVSRPGTNVSRPDPCLSETGPNVSRPGPNVPRPDKRVQVPGLNQYKQGRGPRLPVLGLSQYKQGTGPRVPVPGLSQYKQGAGPRVPVPGLSQYKPGPGLCEPRSGPLVPGPSPRLSGPDPHGQQPHVSGPGPFVPGPNPNAPRSRSGPKPGPRQQNPRRGSRGPEQGPSQNKLEKRCVSRADPHVPKTGPCVLRPEPSQQKQGLGPLDPESEPSQYKPGPGPRVSGPYAHVPETNPGPEPNQQKQGPGPLDPEVRQSQHFKPEPDTNIPEPHGSVPSPHKPGPAPNSPGPDPSVPGPVPSVPGLSTHVTETGLNVTEPGQHVHEGPGQHVQEGPGQHVLGLQGPGAYVPGQFPDQAQFPHPWDTTMGRFTHPTERFPQPTANFLRMTGQNYQPTSQSRCMCQHRQFPRPTYLFNPGQFSQPETAIFPWPRQFQQPIAQPRVSSPYVQNPQEYFQHPLPYPNGYYYQYQFQQLQLQPQNQFQPFVTFYEPIIVFGCFCPEPNVQFASEEYKPDSNSIIPLGESSNCPTENSNDTNPLGEMSNCATEITIRCKKMFVLPEQFKQPVFVPHGKKPNGSEELDQETSQLCTNQTEEPIDVQSENTEQATNLEEKLSTDSNGQKTLDLQENMEITQKDTAETDEETDHNEQHPMINTKVTSDVAKQLRDLNENLIPDLSKKLSNLEEQIQLHIDAELSPKLEKLSSILSDLDKELSADLDEIKSLDIDVEEAANNDTSTSDQKNILLPKDVNRRHLLNHEELTCQNVHLPKCILEQLLPQPKGFLPVRTDADSLEMSIKAPPGFDEIPSPCFDEKFASLSLDTPPDNEDEAPLYTDLRKVLELYEKGDERPNGQLPLYLR